VLGERANEGLALRDIGFAYEHQGDIAQALVHYTQAMDMLEAVRAVAGSEQGRAGFIAQHADIYQRTALLYHQQGQDDLAFLVSERGRARAFLDSLATGAVQLSDQASAALLAQEQETYTARQSAQDALASARAAKSSDAALVAGLEQQLKDATTRYAAAQAAIEQSNGQLAELVPGRTSHVLGVADVQKLLAPQTTLVSFSVGTEQTLAFILTQERFQTAVLSVGQSALRDQVRALLDSPAFQQQAHPPEAVALYTSLIAPLKQYLTTPHLAIIPHQALHYLPFAALSDGSRYLTDDYVLSVLPSASALPFIRANTGRPPAPPLILDNPVTGQPDLAPLPFAEREAQAVAALYGVQPLLGNQATEAELRVRVAQAGILHLAAHGRYDPAAPLASLLALALGAGQQPEADGRLEAGEVYSLDLWIWRLPGRRPDRRCAAPAIIQGLLSVLAWSEYREGRWIRLPCTSSQDTFGDIEQQLIGVRMLLAAIHTTSRANTARDRLNFLLQPRRLPHRLGHAHHVQPQRLGCFGQAARRLLPTAHQQQPVLHDLPQDFGIHLAQHPPLLHLAQHVDLPLALPELENQLDLPARMSQDHRLSQCELRGRDARDKHGPSRQRQPHRADRLALLARRRPQAPPPLIGHLLRHPLRQQSCFQVRGLAQTDRQIQGRRVGVGRKQRQQIPPASIRGLERGGGLGTRQPPHPAPRQLSQTLQLPVAQIGQPQCAWRQRQIQAAVAVGVAAILELGQPAPSSQVQLQLHLERGGAVISAAATAFPDLGRAGRQHDGGAILEIDTVEAFEQRDGDRIGGHDGANSSSQHLLQTQRGLMREALIEALRRELDTQRGSGLGQVIERRLGVGQQTKRQGLGEDAARDLRLALNKAGLAASAIGFGGQHGLQGFGNLWYRLHWEAPVGHQLCEYSRMTPQVLLFVYLRLMRMPPCCLAPRFACRYPSLIRKGR
jgi:CHAT domain-containing protein